MNGPLKLIAWVAFAAAGLGVMVALTEGAWFLVGPAVSAAISGVVFLAMAEVLELLTAIRDQTRPSGSKPLVADSMGDPPAHPPRSLEEVEAGIARLKATRAADPGSPTRP